MNIPALYTAAGVRQTPDDEGVFTLANSTTYYAEICDDIEDRSGFSVHYEWNAALVAAITLEATNKDKRYVTAYQSTKWRDTGATTISPAASASGTVPHYADYMAKRIRIKIAVTTGGTLEIWTHSKERSAR